MCLTLLLIFGALYFVIVFSYLHQKGKQLLQAGKTDSLAGFRDFYRCLPIGTPAPFCPPQA